MHSEQWIGQIRRFRMIDAAVRPVRFPEGGHRPRPAAGRTEQSVGQRRTMAIRVKTLDCRRARHFNGGGRTARPAGLAILIR